MPTLSLQPINAGPPDNNTARADGGTDGREGNNAAGTNSSPKENTWTRLFQSYIQQDKLGTATSLKSTSKNDSVKGKATSETADAATVTSPSTQAVATDPTAATARPIITAAAAIQAPLVVQTTPTTTLQAAAIPVAGPIGKQSVTNRASLISSNSTNPATATTTSQLTNTVAAEPAPAVGTKTPLQAETTPLQTEKPAPTPTATASTPPVVVSGIGLQTNTAPTAATASKSTPVSSPNQQPAAVSDTALSTPPPTAPVVTPSVQSAVKQVTDQTVSLPKSMPDAVVSALSTVQGTTSNNVVSAPAAPSVSAGKTLTTGIAKANMVRSQVLAGSSAQAKSDAADAESSSADSSSSGSNGNSDAGTGQNSFQNQPAFATVGAVQTGVAAAANAIQITSSSQTERLQVVAQISSHIQSMQPSTSNPNTMTVSIQPPHWGEVKISVTLDPSQPAVPGSSNISATVTASTPEVQSVLQQHVEDLKNSLSTAGLHLDKFDVGVTAVAASSQSGSSTGHHAGQQGSNSGQQAYQGAIADTNAGSGGFGNSSQSSFGAGTGDDTGNSASTTIESVTIANPLATPSSSSGSTRTSRIDMQA